MKFSFKMLLSAFALSLAASLPLARAADEAQDAAPRKEEPSAQKLHDDRPHRPAADKWKALKGKLNLTSEQEEKIVEIRKSHQEEFKKATQENRQKLMETRQAERAEIRAVLTPEQQKQFDEMKPAKKKDTK